MYQHPAVDYHHAYYFNALGRGDNAEVDKDIEKTENINYVHID